MNSFSLRVMWKQSLNVKLRIIKLTKLVSKFCSTLCQYRGSPCNLVKQLLTTGKLWMQRQSPLLVRWKGLFITSRAVYELLMYRPLTALFLTQSTQQNGTLTFHHGHKTSGGLFTEKYIFKSSILPCEFPFTVLLRKGLSYMKFNQLGTTGKVLNGVIVNSYLSSLYI